MEETKELRFKKDVYKNRCGFDNNGGTSGKREIEDWVKKLLVEEVAWINDWTGTVKKDSERRTSNMII